jgi:hypothetical protein
MIYGWALLFLGSLVVFMVGPGVFPSIPFLMKILAVPMVMLAAIVFAVAMVTWWRRREDRHIAFAIALFLAIPVCIAVDGLIFGTNWLLGFIGANPNYSEKLDILFWVAGVFDLFIFALILAVLSSRWFEEAVGKASR